MNKINLKRLINFLIFIFQNSMGLLSVYNMPLVSRTINVIDRCLHQYHSSNLAATKWETRHHLNERRKQREDLSWLKQTRSVVLILYRKMQRRAWRKSCQQLKSKQRAWRHTYFSTLTGPMANSKSPAADQPDLNFVVAEEIVGSASDEEGSNVDSG